MKKIDKEILNPQTITQSELSNNSKANHSIFESQKKTENGIEFWSARNLAKTLEYSDYRNFLLVIEKAKKACTNSGYSITDHFVEVNGMIIIGKGGKRNVSDIKLSRYACYLIVQNGDPKKPVIANGQTYFAIQTRRQELADNQNFQNLKEDEKRFFLRNELKEHNKQLVETASHAGIETPPDFAIFQNHGYKGLYGGLGAKEIHKKKKLTKNQKILDHMGSIELAANLFRATQTEDKIRREKIQKKEEANQTHFQVGSKVRKTIKELGGVMPEELPTPDKSVKLIKLNKEK
ncbi:MAG TPA: DNA damage-inducible protein D [Chlamydiales bacterium]|nr:DNA damage-inducible protein D [Chlamydiales bacterium]